MANTKVFLTVSGAEHDLLSEYGLIMSAIDIDAPAPKLFTVDIPHGSGKIDKSDYFGAIKYYNRNITAYFSVSHNVNAVEKYGAFLSTFAGRSVQLRTTLDPGNYFKGRLVTVSKLARSDRVWNFSIVLDAAPYRYSTSTGKAVSL